VLYKSADEMPSWCPENKLGQRIACSRKDYPERGQCLVVIGPQEEIAAIGLDRGDCIAPRNRTLQWMAGRLSWFALASINGNIQRMAGAL
jgi:hypothetical protein